MKKRALAVLMAVAVMLLGTTTVYAAGSPTSGGTVEAPEAGQAANTAVTGVESPEAYLQETSTDAGFTTSAVGATTVQSAVVAAQNLLLNHLANTGAVLGNAGLSAAAGQAGATVTAEMLSVVNVTASGAAKGADGLYTLTIRNGKINAGDTIAVMHYDGSWGLVVPTAVGAGYATVKVANCSPFAIVRLNGGAGGAAVGAKTLSLHDALEQAALAAQAAERQQIAYFASLYGWNQQIVDFLMLAAAQGLNPLGALGLVGAP